MILKKIMLRNYRNILVADVDFNMGITGILGHNGAGKSNFIEAIVVALYGWEASKSTKEMMLGPKKESLGIKLWLEIDGQDYLITRELFFPSLNTKATLEIDGVQVADGPREVTAYMSGVIGMDYKNFLISSFARQKQLNALASYDPADRKKLILQMLGISGIESSLKTTRDRIRGIKEDIKTRQAILPDVVEIEDNIAQYKQEEKELNQKIIDHDNLLSQIQAAYSQIEINSNKAQSAEEMYNQLQRQINEQTDRVNLEIENEIRIEAELEAINQVELELDQTRILIGETTQHKDEFEKLQQMARQRELLAEIKNNIYHTTAVIREMSQREQTLSLSVERKDELSKELADKKSQSTELENKAREWESKKNSAQTELDMISPKLESLEKQLSILTVQDEASHICPTCQQPVKDKQGLIAHLTQEQLTAVERRNVLIELLSIANRELLDVNNTLSQYKERINQINDLLISISADSSELTLLRPNLAREKQTLQRYNEDLTAIEQLPYDAQRHQHLLEAYNDLEGLVAHEGSLVAQLANKPSIIERLEKQKTQRAGAEEKLSDLKEQGMSLDSAHEEYVNLQTKLAEKGIELQSAKLLQVELSGDKRVLNERKAKAESELDRHAKLQGEIRFRKVEMQRYELLKQSLEDFRIDLITRIRPILARKTSEYLEILTDGRYTMATLDEDYNISIYDLGIPYPAKRFSGGEEDLANLCLRLAISELIVESSGSATSLIILDEVLGSQDDMRQQNIMQLLPKLTKRFAQILMISHVSQVQNQFPSRIVAQPGSLPQTSNFIND